jgi:hypothetical protein
MDYRYNFRASRASSLEENVRSTLFPSSCTRSLHFPLRKVTPHMSPRTTLRIFSACVHMRRLERRLSRGFLLMWSTTRPSPGSMRATWRKSTLLVWVSGIQQVLAGRHPEVFPWNTYQFHWPSQSASDESIKQNRSWVNGMYAIDGPITGIGGRGLIYWGRMGSS